MVVVVTFSSGAKVQGIQSLDFKFNSKYKLIRLTYSSEHSFERVSYPSYRKHHHFCIKFLLCFLREVVKSWWVVKNLFIIWARS